MATDVAITIEDDDDVIDQVDGAGGIVDVINTLLPFEKHFPGCNYLGPGTNLEKKLDKVGRPREQRFEPVDRVDEAALKHDIAYTRYPNLRELLPADKDMIAEIKQIKQPTCRERCEMCLVLPIMRVKCFLGRIILWFWDLIGYEPA